MTRVCRVCGSTVEISEPRPGRNICRKCSNDYNREYKRANPHIWKREYQRSKDAYIYRAIEWNKENKEARATIQRTWRERNPEMGRYYTAKRRSSRLRATPDWLTNTHKEQMKQIYRDCPEGYEVDHIVPLQGERVSGLHVPWNLQHLKINENRGKCNYYEE